MKYVFSMKYVLLIAFTIGSLILGCVATYLVNSCLNKNRRQPNINDFSLAIQSGGNGEYLSVRGRIENLEGLDALANSKLLDVVSFEGATFGLKDGVLLKSFQSLFMLGCRADSDKKLVFLSPKLERVILGSCDELVNKIGLSTESISEVWIVNSPFYGETDHWILRCKNLKRLVLKNNKLIFNFVFF